MNIREISDIFKDTADNITAIKSYNFGWASDRVRQGNTEDFQELNEFPRVFFAVPTITGSDQTRKQDTYQVTLFFDDLLGYDNEGDEDPTLQIDKWANLQQYANYFVQRLNKIKQSILPNYLFIPEAPSITFDSFTGLQRMITVQLSFNLVVPTNCDPGIITLVQCIANIVTSSNLTASLTTVLKFAASLEGRATVTADINFVQKVASSLNANALLSGDINFVQKAQASLLTSASVTGNLTIPQLLNASLLATGTTTADLTVNAPSASLLLDLYPNAAVAYSLRKLRTAYTGSAIRVRRSSDNTEQDIGFVGNDLNTTALTTFVGAGNGFVTTWYDQSGNARNATQATQANQPQIVSSGVVILNNSKPSLQYDGVDDSLRTIDLIGISGNTNVSAISVHKQINTASRRNIYHFGGTDTLQSFALFANLRGTGQYEFATNANDFRTNFSTNTNTILSFLIKIPGIINTTTSIYFNSNLSADRGGSSANVPNFTNTILSIGNWIYPDFPSPFSGNISEVIFYNDSQASNRTGIETNINTHYAIY
jgi:hypothetical protein